MTKASIALVFLLACHTAAPPPQPPRPRADVVACDAGPDDTATVQAAVTAGACLPPGTYNVDSPPLNAVGRRRDAMLTGAVLCGVRSDLTTIRFRGDAFGQFWVGMMLTTGGVVHDVKLDSTCLTDTGEQTHLIRAGEHVNAAAIYDAVLVHPKRATLSGDCVNVVGNMTTPNLGMLIHHVQFNGCARIGIQISRGLTNGIITDNTFADCGMDIGSEGSGGIDALTVRHNTFTATAMHGYSNAFEHITHLVFDHNIVQHRPVLLYFTDDALITHNHITGEVPGVSAVLIGDSAHRVQLSDNTITQIGTAPAVSAGPLRTNRQADLSAITFDSGTIVQTAPANITAASGVAGFHLTNSDLTYTGPGTFVPVALASGPSVAIPPAVSVPATDIVEAGTTHIGFP